MPAEHAFIESWRYHEPAFEHRAIANASWLGHRRFGYDLVRNSRPRRIVELGVCYGISFFAFCQAVKDGGLDTALFGVDTWRGDEHTGFFDDSVRESFEHTLHDRFSSLNVSQMVTTFDEARRRVEGHEIDLLHIDGHHTYEASRHDFETWIETMAPNGVVLFHDIAETKGDFGVHRLWAELEERYGTVTFSHSHGLGVLFVGLAPSDRDLEDLGRRWVEHYENADVGATTASPPA